MKLKNLFSLLLVFFTSLLSFSKFSVSYNNKFNNSQKQVVSLTNNNQPTNVFNLPNQEITSFSNDDSNKISFSITEFKDNSGSFSRSISREFEIFSTPSEKYFGYYLKKHFNVSPRFFINLAPEEQQLYKEYINENPDQEYLKQHKSELLEEKSNPEHFQKDFSSITFSHFSIVFYDVPFGFKVKLDSVFIVDFSFLVAHTILLVLSDGTSLEIEVEVEFLFKYLKSIILDNLGSYEKSSKYLIGSSTTTKTEFNYKSFELTKSLHKVNIFRQDIFKVFKAFDVDLLIPHLHYDH